MLSDREIENQAIAFVAGYRAGEQHLNGRDQIAMFIGCIFERNPEMDDYQEVQRVKNILMGVAT